VIEVIQARLPIDERLAQLAEEAAELSQAALKMRRAIDRKNPTPVSVVDAYAGVKEEIADVLLCLRVAGFSIASDTYQAAMDLKLKRWSSRLMASTLDPDDKTVSGLLEEY
jgi:NTP pyrophosphatase (non-canonical NTP hydrolase)